MSPRTHLSTCPLCEATCGIAIDLDGDEIVAIRGDEADPFSRGYLCPKALALKDVHEDPDRLRQPLRRAPGGWREVGWDEAFGEVARRLREIRREHGADAIAMYRGNPTAHSYTTLLYSQAMLEVLGTRNRYSATSTDQLPHMLAALAMFGHQLLLPVPDLDRTDHLLVLGANPLVSNGSVMTAPDVKARLRALRARGGRLVVIDPRRTETAHEADEHHFVRPGTDALLLASMLHVIFEEERTRSTRLEAMLAGGREVRQATKRFPPESVEPAIGIDAATIRRLARDFASAPRAVCYPRFGCSTQEFGGLCQWLAIVLNTVTGNLDRPGGAMFARPALDLVRGAELLGQKGSFDRYRSRVRGLPEFGGELPVATLADEIETPGPGQVRALVVAAGNPVLSVPNGRRLEAALGTLDFMVSIDIYLNETSRHADLILPPTSALERDHYDAAFALVSVRNVAKYALPVFEKSADQRHEWEIFLELGARIATGEQGLGRQAGSRVVALGRRVGPQKLLDLALRFGPYGDRLRKGSGGLSLRSLIEHPHGIDLGPLVSQLPELLRTPDRRIQLAPECFVADLARLERARDAAGGGVTAGLVLVGRRRLRSNNSWMHNSLRLVKGPPECTLLMHPDDARERGLADAERVSVRSRVGAITVALSLTDAMMRGVVSLPHGWGHDRPGVRLAVAVEHAGASVNDVTDDQRIDALCGTAAFSGVPVEVERAS